jgi:hypothetical protein
MKLRVKFEGELESLKARLEDEGLAGEWREEENGVHMAKFADGTGLHWSSSKGTLWCDGPKPAAKVLECWVVMALHWMYVAEEGY